MTVKCPHCPQSLRERPKNPETGCLVVRYGHFRRRSDGQRVQRFLCCHCRRCFSHATLNACYRQKKRHVNYKLKWLLCSNVSQRRAARILNLHRLTVTRKLLFLASQASCQCEANKTQPHRVTNVQFDELETFEHTKCKPVSILIAVEENTRWILGFSVAKMPSKGKLATISRRKYGEREDERPRKRQELFTQLKEIVHPEAVFKSDMNPHYGPDIKRCFPHATHVTHKGRRGCVTGQGELKKIGFDPLFSLNHTCAMFRANINRLIRKTWCSTKRVDRLRAHVQLYVQFHNQFLLSHYKH